MKKIYPPQDEVNALWESAKPVTACRDVAAYLRSRGIDPERVAEDGCARALDGTQRTARWNAHWYASGHRLLLPMVDHHGQIRSFRARSVEPRPRVKTLSAGIPKKMRRENDPTYSCVDLMMMTRAGLEFVRHLGIGDELIITEGEMDMLSWLMVEPNVPVWCVFSGSWPRPGERSPWSSVVPDSVDVYIRTDGDTQGKKYAEQIGHALSFCDLLRLEAHPDVDDNDRLLHGDLHYPPEDCEPWEPSPLPEQAKQTSLDGALRGEEAPDHRAIPFARAGLDRECDKVRGAGKGGRNNALRDAARACARFRTNNGGPLEESEVFNALMSAAESVGQDRARAAGTIGRGFQYGQGDVFTLPAGDPWTPPQRRQQAPRKQPPAPVSQPEVTRSEEEAPIIWLDKRPYREILDEAEAAIRDSDYGVYQRNGRLVHVVRHGMGNTAPLVSKLDLERVHEIADATARWRKEKFDKKTGEVEIVHARPPKWVASKLCARDVWDVVPQLEAITEVPMLRADGSVLDTPGHDEETGILYDPPPGVTFPRGPSQPTLADAQAAIARLKEPLQDFPFAADHHRSTMLAAILTGVARPSIDGPTPLFLIQATTPGSGKTLLAKVVAQIATGRALATSPQPSDDAEDEKRVVAMALSGFGGIYCIDNIARPLGSPVMSQALTSTTIQGRVLGKSEFLPLTVKWVWLATGQNVQFRDDLARRTVPCNLKPECERPEERSGFGIASLEAWVKKRREALVTDALTVLRAYLRAGSPIPQGKSSWGGFEEWSLLVRNALIWAGEADPLDGCKEMREGADSHTVAWGQAFEALEELYGESTWTSADIAKRLNSGISEVEETNTSAAEESLRDALVELGCEKYGKIATRSLGYKLRTIRGRIIDHRRLVGGEKGRRGVEWAMQRRLETGSV